MTPPTQPAGKTTLTAQWLGLSAEQRARLKACAVAMSAITLAFALPLISLINHALHSELHSHIPLIPLVSAYLLGIRRTRLPSDYCSSPGWAFALMTAGFLMLALRWKLPAMSRNDELALVTLGYVSFIAASGFVVLGRRWMAAAAFPIAFLLFMVPLPDALVDRLETASKLASAEAADWFLGLTGTPNVRVGNFFQLPNITLEVAQECSGIRSSWVLFITGLLAANLFLKSTWHRAVIVAFIVPLGILRNGFRIMVICLLCVHEGPHMVDSIIHRHGGPFFFVLSLIPLFLLLWALRRHESHSGFPAQHSQSS